MFLSLQFKELYAGNCLILKERVHIYEYLVPIMGFCYEARLVHSDGEREREGEIDRLLLIFFICYGIEELVIRKIGTYLELLAFMIFCHFVVFLVNRHCGHDFKTEANLRSHIKVVHKPRNPKYTCKTCNKMFMAPKDLARHSKVKRLLN